MFMWDRTIGRHIDVRYVFARFASMPNDIPPEAREILATLAAAQARAYRPAVKGCGYCGATDHAEHCPTCGSAKVKRASSLDGTLVCGNLDCGHSPESVREAIAYAARGPQAEIEPEPSLVIGTMGCARRGCHMDPSNPLCNICSDQICASHILYRHRGKLRRTTPIGVIVYSTNLVCQACANTYWDAP